VLPCDLPSLALPARSPGAHIRTTTAAPDRPTAPAAARHARCTMATKNHGDPATRARERPPTFCLRASQTRWRRETPEPTYINAVGGGDPNPRLSRAVSHPGGAGSTFICSPPSNMAVTCHRSGARERRHRMPRRTKTLHYTDMWRIPTGPGADIFTTRLDTAATIANSTPYAEPGLI
jgi:hypothetical protein